MWADTDFLLALVKESDWLKSKAEQILKKYAGSITTSMSVLIEVALVCQRLGISVRETFIDIFRLIAVDNVISGTCLEAALYVDKHGFNVFDAFHAASCGSDSIISSDSVYEKIGMHRIRLEE